MKTERNKKELKAYPIWYKCTNYRYLIFEGDVLATSPLNAVAKTFAKLKKDKRITRISMMGYGFTPLHFTLSTTNKQTK